MGGRLLHVLDVSGDVPVPLPDPVADPPLVVLRDEVKVSVLRWEGVTLVRKRTDLGSGGDNPAIP
jgi:hypothetical protein